MIKIPDKVLKLCNTLHGKGHQAWLVGGAIRDFIREVEPHDWDVATDATPDVVSSIFNHTVLTGEKHGTITVVDEGETFEVTTFRGDGTYTDGRHPDGVVFVSTIEEDLQRRDFTANAIAYNPITDKWCDPFGGREDLHRGIIKCVGDPMHRFGEDGLRILRACRFRAALGAQLDKTTEDAIPRCLDTYSKVAKERVHDEWIKIMKTERPSRAFEVMLSSGILGIEVPEMMPMVGCTQNRYHQFDVWNHTLAVVDYCPGTDPILRLGALFHDIGKPASKGLNPKTGDATFYEHEILGAEMTRRILISLKFSNEETDRIVHLVRYHFVRYEKGGSKVSIRRWVRKVGLEHVDSLLTLARADIAGKGNARVPLETSVLDELQEKIKTMRIEEKIPTSTKVLEVNGSDVMQVLGIKPGPEVGKVLESLLEIVTEDPSINTREGLLKKLEEMRT